VALAILSHLNIASLMSAVANEDDILLAITPGIGKKTAQKLIVELKDRLVKLELNNSNNQMITPSSNPNTSKALSALQNATKMNTYLMGLSIFSDFNDYLFFNAWRISSSVVNE
jgi:Holliday junction resolvasome RuvABC DNA-binding subunit